MWPLGVVVFQVAIRVCLHLFHRLIPGRPPLDTEVFIQQCAVQSLDKAVALRPAYLGCPMLNLNPLLRAMCPCGHGHIDHLIRSILISGYGTV